MISAAIGALPGLARLVAQHTLDPALSKALLPPPHRRPADADAPRYQLRRVPIRRGEHNARPLDMLARPIAVGCDRRQLFALNRVQHHTDLLCHAPHPPTMAQYCIFPSFSPASVARDVRAAMALFEGMSCFRFRDGLIAHYGEAFDRGVALVQLDFSAERIKQILARAATAQNRNPETQTSPRSLFRWVSGRAC